MPARILVVAADSEFQSLLGNTLRADGHEILLANDAQEAARRMAADGPDLVALDSDLPDMPATDLLRQVRRAEASAGGHLPIILIDKVNSVEAKVGALRSGADWYLAKPVHPLELSARVRGLLARFERDRRHSAPADKPRVGRVHGFYGAKGGVGSTTIAINTAIALHRELHKSVVLVDGSLQFGDHRVFLDLGPNQRSIVDAVTTTGFDVDLLRKTVVRHDSGVDLLLAPSSPENAELVSTEQHHLLRTIEQLRTIYDYVLIDMDMHLDDHMLDVISVADRLIVVMTADLACLKNVRLLLATMAQLAVPDERLMLVLNRANAFTGISTKSVENVLRRPIEQQIVNDYRSAISALNSGTPFMYNRTDSPLGRAVLEFARRVAGEQAPTRAEASRLQLAAAVR
jgi:pilus assembly protein CpaE